MVSADLRPWAKSGGARNDSTSSVPSVTEVLDDLAAHQPDPYVLHLPRQPGTKEARARTFEDQVASLTSQLETFNRRSNSQLPISLVS